MSRKSFQRVTLSVELTLPPGVNQTRAAEYCKAAITEHAGGLDSQDPLFGMPGPEAPIVRVTKRETIYIT